MILFQQFNNSLIGSVKISFTACDSMTWLTPNFLGQKYIRHPGCACHAGFDGDHCEFLLGTKPNYINMNASPKHHMPMLITFTTLFSFSLLALATLIVSWCQQKYGRQRKPTVVPIMTKHQRGLMG